MHGYDQPQTQDLTVQNQVMITYKTLCLHLHFNRKITRWRVVYNYQGTHNPSISYCSL